MLGSVVEYYGMDLEILWVELFEYFQDVLLNGFGNEDILFCYVNFCGYIMEKVYLFEGILFNLEWCYWEIDF